MPSANLSAGDATHRPSNRIMTFEQWCEHNSFSRVTGWRILKSGSGPKVTRISTRRIGIREDHHAEWLDNQPVRTAT